MFRVATPSKHQGYFLVPTYPELAISKEGVVVVEETGKKLAVCQKKNLTKYPHVWLNGKDFHVHRLMAETFLDSSGFENPLVNHKDGIKFHNWLDNLEWTDYSGNLKHAYQSGLRSDNHPVLAKDLRTGEIKKFISIGECAKYFSTSAANVFHQLRLQNFGKVYRGYYVLIREGQSWPPVGPEAIGQHRNGTSKEVGAYSEVEKKLILFRSGFEAAQFFNVTSGAIYKWVRKAISSAERYHEVNGWKIGELKDIRDLFRSKAEELQLDKKTWERKRRVPPRIRITDLQSGAIREMNSLKEFARELGIKKTAIQKYIWKNGGTWHNRYRVEYLKRHE